MITRDDLKWWLDLAPTLDWTYARTYARTAPHEYVVAGRTPGLSMDDTVRAGHVIRTFGEPAKFYTWTGIYLSHDGLKWWAMDKSVDKTNLINRAPTAHVYGPQNAPRTRSGKTTPFDAFATEWDEKHGATDEERERIVAAVANLGLGKRPRILDVGCGTGLALDLGLTTPDRYVGIDPSQAMLNQLVVKHPHVAGLHAMTFADALERRVLGGSRFDVVLMLGGTADLLDDFETSQLPGLGRSVFSLDRPSLADSIRA